MDSANDSKKISMNVMSFNLRVDVPIDGIHYWPHRIPLVVETIHHHQPAILGLQEVSDRMASDLFPLLPQYESRGLGRNHDFKGERVSILFLTSIFSCIKEETFWLSDTPYLPGSMDVEDGFPRICTMVELQHRITKNIIRVMNVHFSYRSIRNRQQNTTTLLSFYHQYQQRQPLPTVLLGDFNAPLEDPLHRLIQQTGFKDAVAYLNLQRVHTYHEFKGWPGLSAIDFIYGNEGVTFKTYLTIQEKQSGKYASDHYAIAATIETN